MVPEIEASELTRTCGELRMIDGMKRRLEASTWVHLAYSLVVPVAGAGFTTRRLRSLFLR